MYLVSVPVDVRVVCTCVRTTHIRTVMCLVSVLVDVRVCMYVCQKASVVGRLPVVQTPALNIPAASYRTFSSRVCAHSRNHPMCAASGRLQHKHVGVGVNHEPLTGVLRGFCNNNSCCSIYEEGYTCTYKKIPTNARASWRNNCPLE